MSAFFVGQRVRLVRSFDGVSPAIESGEGVISGFGLTPEGYVFSCGLVNPSHCNCFVNWDWLDGQFAQHTNQLEPIVPSGHCPAELTVEELLPFLREQVSA